MGPSERIGKKGSNGMIEHTDNLRGVFAPVVTPFGADLRPDPDRYLRHCRWLIAQNCGLAVFGTNSRRTQSGPF